MTLQDFIKDSNLPDLPANELLVYLETKEASGEDWHREIRWLKGFIDANSRQNL